MTAVSTEIGMEMLSGETPSRLTASPPRPSWRRADLLCKVGDGALLASAASYGVLAVVMVGVARASIGWGLLAALFSVSSAWVSRSWVWLVLSRPPRLGGAGHSCGHPIRRTMLHGSGIGRN